MSYQLGEGAQTLTTSPIDTTGVLKVPNWKCLTGLCPKWGSNPKRIFVMLQCRVADYKCIKCKKNLLCKVGSLFEKKKIIYLNNQIGPFADNKKETKDQRKQAPNSWNSCQPIFLFLPRPVAVSFSQQLKSSSNSVQSHHNNKSFALLGVGRQEGERGGGKSPFFSITGKTLKRV